MGAGHNDTATIGIVGGGKGGLELLGIFTGSDKVKVSYLVDRNANAPGVLAAKAAGIEVIPDLNLALDKRTVDFVVEVTGKENVVQLIRDGLKGDTQLIHHRVALFLFSVLVDESRKGVASQVAGEIATIKTDLAKSLQDISSIVGGIDDMTSELNMLSLNARIEAARAGDQGKGFAVVANEVGRAAEAVQRMAKEIAGISTDMLTVSDNIDKSLRKLR